MVDDRRARRCAWRARATCPRAGSSCTFRRTPRRRSRAALPAAGAVPLAARGARRAAHRGRPAVVRPRRDARRTCSTRRRWSREYHSPTKGCYVGQEVIARLEARGGNVNKLLRGLRLSAPGAAGDRIHAEGKEVGRITTAGVSPRARGRSPWATSTGAPPSRARRSRSAAAPATVARLPLPACRGRRGMKIYTKTGDGGETGLVDGSRVRKDHPRVGRLRRRGRAERRHRRRPRPRRRRSSSQLLDGVQRDLFAIGAQVADPRRAGGGAQGEGGARRRAHRRALERAIDAREAQMPPLTRLHPARRHAAGARRCTSRARCAAARSARSWPSAAPIPWTR